MKTPARGALALGERGIVIVPTYNESENITRIVPQILDQDSRLEVLVVDDNSPDGTGQLADEMAAENPRVHVLHRPGKEGLGRAYLAGFRWALERDYAFIFEMDADFCTTRGTSRSSWPRCATPTWSSDRATGTARSPWSTGR